MMASKGAIVPVGKVMKDAGCQVRSLVGLHSAVADLLHGAQRQMLSFPFNSSTTVFYVNKRRCSRGGSTQAARHLA